MRSVNIKIKNTIIDKINENITKELDNFVFHLLNRTILIGQINVNIILF